MKIINICSTWFFVDTMNTTRTLQAKDMTVSEYLDVF